MSQDILVKQDANGFFDLRVKDNDFESVDGFETAIIISLFTDARAPSANVESPERRRGWVGDILTAEIGRDLGSTLWLYEQSRITQNILNQIKQAARESLVWMVEDGIAKDVATAVRQTDTRAIEIDIIIKTLQNRVERFSVLWRRTNLSNIES